MKKNDMENKGHAPDDTSDDFEFLDDLEEETDDFALEDREPEDMEEDDAEEDDAEEDDLELEENVSLSPKKIGIFCGIFVLAVLICIPLWMLTHAQMEKDADQGAAQDVVEETLAVEPTEPSQPSVGAENPSTEVSGEETVPQEPETPQPSESQENTQPSGVEETNGAQSSAENTNPPADPVSGDENMSFTETADSVTAKDVTNLRSVPSTEDSENVVGQLKNGETLNRTGYNDSTGWSRLDYNGQTVYAVTQFLTTDLSYKTPVTASTPNRVSTQDGRVIIFTDCDDYITPKEYVNLRTEPSTSEGDSTVRCQVNNGESMHRTGYSADSGWSRVEYNGEVLYVVSSLTTGVAAE